MKALGYLVEEGDEDKEKHRKMNINRTSNSQQFFKRKTDLSSIEKDKGKASKEQN